MKLSVFLFALLGLTSFSALADCPQALYQKWSLKSQSKQLDVDLKKARMPMTYHFTKDQKANLKSPPFLDVTSPFECNDNTITIKKTVPSYLVIKRISESQLVLEEKKANKVFYFEK